jgi:hypothetical protein
MDKQILMERLAQIKKSQAAYPSTTQMAKNLTKSVVNNVKSVLSGNSLKLSDTEATARLSICRGCDFFNANDERCLKCGCQMAIKTYLRAEKCPIGKW